MQLCIQIMNMPFPEQLDIFEFIAKGILIGIIASAPMGPVGILCIQRTLNKGRWFGFITGVGAAVSDFIYALIVGLGMSFVMEPLKNPEYQFIIKIVGSVLLLLFGFYCFFSNPKKKMYKKGSSKGTLWHNAITAFFVTFSNPLIIFLIMAAFAQFSFVQPSRPIEMIAGFLSIPFGALIWWYGLTWAINKIRKKFNMNGIVIINRIIGTIVILFSFLILLGTIFNLYHLPSYY